MKLEWKSLLSLKVQVLIVFLLLWNVGLLFAMCLGGGDIRGVFTPVGMRITGYLCLTVCLFSLAVAMLKPIQSKLIAPSRFANFNPREFYFLALLTGILAISRFTLQ